MGDRYLTQEQDEQRTAQFDVVEDSELEEPSLEFMSEEQKEEVVAYIESELNDIEMDRGDLLERRKEWRLLLTGRPNEELRDVRERETVRTYKNSARVIVPLIPMLSQTMYAQLMGTFDRNPLWTTTAHQTDTQAHYSQAKLLTKYMNMLVESAIDLNMERVKRDSLMESPTMGVAFYKTIYNLETLHHQREQEEQEIVLHNGPKIMVVDYEHLWFRDGWRTLQEVPFLAHEIPMSVVAFKQRVAQGWYGEEDVVLKHIRTTPTADEQNRAHSESRTEHGKETIDLFEVYMYYDVDGDGRLEDLKLFYHRPSKTIVRAGYNDFGIRPFVAAPHVHRPNRITGIGICEMLEYVQKEMNALHNLFLDNIKLANSIIITKRHGGMVKEKDIHVNAGGATVIPVEEHNDIQVFTIGSQYTSLTQAQQELFQFAMRLVGVNEALAGFPSSQLGSRDTAMGQQQRLSQGASILSTIARAHEEALSEVGRMVYMRLVQNKGLVMEAEGRRQRLTQEELDLLDQALTVPEGELPLRAIFRVRTTTADQTTEAKRQNMFAINTMYQQYTQAVIQLMGPLFGPESVQIRQQSPELYVKIAELFMGTTKLMKENFEFFDKVNEEEYLPDVTELENAVRRLQEGANELSTQAPGLNGLSGMGGQPTGVAQGNPPAMQGSGGESLLEPN